MITRLKLLSFAFVLLLIQHVDSQCVNENGIVEVGEECDGTVNCTACGFDIIVDLNQDDPNSGNYSMNFFNLDEIVFLANISNTFFTVSEIRNWTAVFLVMIGDPLPVDSEIDFFPRAAFRDGRITSMDYIGYFSIATLSGPNDPRLLRLLLQTGLDTSDVTAGVVAREDTFFTGGDGLLSEPEVEAAIYSAGFRAREHPGFVPREFCIIGTDDFTSDIACVTLNFIGDNDDAPNITYTSVGVATFTEGGEDYIDIVDGTFSITDADHPSFLQMSATAKIVNFTAGDPEFLGLTYTSPEFTSNYDQATGVLTISGAATPSVYEQVLLNLTYFNNMTEPRGASRDIEVTMFDGMHSSRQPAIIRVNINNTNDPPAVSLDGSDPVATGLSVQYTEGSGALAIVPNLRVIDVDPTAMIQRATVVLNNILDFDLEVLNVTLPDVSPSLINDGDQIHLWGPHPLAVYTSVLQTLTYEHLDGNPGNPNTTESRAIIFEVVDDAGTTNFPESTVTLTITPVNDAPILLIVSDVAVREASSVQTSGRTNMSFPYMEDDPSLVVGRDIYLRDVDSNIASVTIDLSNLLNGARDVIYLNSTLLSQFGVTQNTSESATDTRTLTLTGQALVEEYEQILQSLTYRNLYTNDSIANGQRVISVTANDTYGAESNSIIIIVNVTVRNDGPILNLGAGPNMDFMITFIEDNYSIPIVLQHILSLMDEEDHNIIRVTIQLLALNGDLDSTDALIPRTPFPMEFIDNLFRPLTTTLIDIATNASIGLYERVLRSIYYTNDADEPTLFNASGSPLIRVVQIVIYDERFNDDPSSGIGVTNLTVGITIEPINDNPPRILLNAEPAGCASSNGGTSYTGSSSQIRTRRSVSAALVARRKRRVKETPDDSKAPKVVSVEASFNDQGCLNLVTIFFNTLTNAPIVATERSIRDILSFDHPEVNAAVKYGVWLDYRQLVVIFEGCVKRKTVQGVKDRGIKVFFEAERGSCDWSSTCSDNLICFQNLTGCPISGPYLVSLDVPCPPGSTGKDCNEGSATPPSHSEFTYSGLLLASILLTLATVALIFAFLCFKACKTPRTAKPSIFDLEFKDSTVITMNSELQHKTPRESETASIQDVMVVASPPPPPREERSMSPKGTSFSVRSSIASEKKERRKIDREKKKGSQGAEDEARIPILGDDEPENSDEEVVTLFPEARSCELSDEDQTLTENLHVHEEGRENGDEEDSPLNRCHRELSSSRVSTDQSGTKLGADISQDRQTSQSQEAQLNGSKH